MRSSVELPLNLHSQQDDQERASGQRCQQQNASPKHPYYALLYPIYAWHITAQIGLIDHVTQGVQRMFFIQNIECQIQSLLVSKKLLFLSRPSVTL